MQNYQNHRRFYTPHHFIFYPVGLILFGISLYRMGYSLGNNNGEFWIWFVLSGVIFFNYMGCLYDAAALCIDITKQNYSR